MQTSLKEKGNNTVELTVELDAGDLIRYIKEARQDLSEHLVIDGFRKGKVPAEQAEKHLGESQIREAALQRALQGSFAEVVKNRNLDVLRTTDLSVKENTKEKLVYTVLLALFPEFSLPDLKTVKVSRQDVQVTDQEVQQTLETVRTMRAEFADKEGPVQNGDRVEVDFLVTMGGKRVQGGESKNHPLVIGGKSFIPGFEEQLVGMNKNQEKKFALKAPDDYFQHELAGKDLDFTVTIKTIQAVNLPEVSDTFAQSLGVFKTVGELRENIRGNITEGKQRKERQRVRLEILDLIIKATQIPIPDMLIGEQLDSMVEQFDRTLHEKGMELNIYLARIGKTQDQLRNDWKKDAEKQARIALILQKVAKANHIVVEPAEVDEAANEMVQMLLVRGQLNREELNVEELRRNIREQLASEKTLEFIEKSCAA